LLEQKIKVVEKNREESNKEGKGISKKTGMKRMNMQLII
jgi:hypothetical protein